MVRRKASQKKRASMRRKKTIKRGGLYNSPPPLPPPRLPPRLYKNNPFYAPPLPPRNKEEQYERVSPFQKRVTSPTAKYVTYRPKTPRQQDLPGISMTNRAELFRDELISIQKLINERRILGFENLVQNINQAVEQINTHIDNEQELEFLITKYDKEFASDFRKLTTQLLSNQRYYDRTKYCKESLPNCDLQFCKEKGGIFSKRRCVPE
jgi:hypothetical protein